MQAHKEKLSRLSLLADAQEPIDVLVVEDSRTVRSQLKQYLSLLDRVTVFEAETLAQARVLLAARTVPFFCVVLDLTLPDADGHEAVDAIRAFDVPIIVFTGSVNTQLRQAVMDLRVIDYMYKQGAAAIEDVAYLIGRMRQNQSMKVMIVDDSTTFRMHISRLLAQYRFPILMACDGHEALDLLARHPDVALVLTDYHMPHMNGLALVKEIRRKHRREDLAVIAFSDSEQPEISAAMLKAGANDYLNKHFLAEEFYCRVVQNTNMVHFVRELRDMANRDYLTRLHNRRHLFHAAEALFEQAHHAHGQLALAMVDADHFKQVNDRYGHGAGDEALKRIAGVLRKNCQPGDIAARYGGEEFVLLKQLPAGEDALPLFERLCAEVAALDFQWEGKPVPLSVSIGFTTRRAGGLSEMIEWADQAVFHAKALGRNCVVEAETQAPALAPA